MRDELNDPQFAKVYEVESQKIDLAIELARIREKAGLTQRELAKRVGTTQSVIARMENPEYTGYSVRMLQRIAAGLGTRVKIAFEPAGKSKRGEASSR
ncbi:helix-turn-helix domain-containing protein [bacterium]|nr:helix-turn-helix domain-containing protein [bacterium]